MSNEVSIEEKKAAAQIALEETLKKVQEIGRRRREGNFSTNQIFFKKSSSGNSGSNATER